jgi:hypothetical protein
MPPRTAVVPQELLIERRAALQVGSNIKSPERMKLVMIVPLQLLLDTG